MAQLVFCLPSLIFFVITLSFYHINLRSSIIFCGVVFEPFVILSAISFPIKSLFASTVFWIALCEVVLSAPVADCLA